ncbi:MAG: carboxyl-terminal processing protease [Phycisphaerales bacterium]
MRAVTTRYSHRDRLGIDWGARLERFEDDLVASKTLTEFARHTARLLAAAKDKHIHVRVADMALAGYSRPVTPNVNERTLEGLVPGWAEPNGRVRPGRFDDGAGYLAIRSWSEGDPRDFDSVFAALEELQGAPGLIVDVRLNGGGDELLARSVAGCFIDGPRLYATHKGVTDDGGFIESSERWFGPAPGRAHFAGPVAVLMGPVCMSCNEAFLLIMRRTPNAKFVGLPSQGSLGNPRRHDLGNGVTVSLPSWVAMTADGQAFEGVGLAPDIRVDATPEAFETADPVLDAALAWLRTGG